MAYRISVVKRTCHAPGRRATPRFHVTVVAGDANNSHQHINIRDAFFTVTACQVPFVASWPWRHSNHSITVIY